MFDTDQHPLPLRLGSTDDFDRIRTTLQTGGFDDKAVCEFLKIKRLSAVDSAPKEGLDYATVSEHLGLFIKLFLLLQTAPRKDVERILDRPALDSFLALDLLRPGEFNGGCYYASVFLYPVDGLWIASDRHRTPDGSPFVPPTDVVFPAIFAGTLHFLRLISRRPAKEVLDLCAGSGIGALSLSRHVEHAVASDITGRATHFARFNRRLNRCDNVEVVHGDLYGAVTGRTFDRIIAHPPYVPSLGDAMVFRDGGEAGETILRRIVEELPRYLRPGGTFFALSLGLDTREGPLEERARHWLGDPQLEFDVVFAFGTEKSPKDIVQDIDRRTKNLAEDKLNRLLTAYEKLGVVRLVYGALVIHRHASPGLRPRTARPTMSDQTNGAAFERFFTWHQRHGELEFLAQVSRCRPCLAPQLRLKVTHLVEQNEFVPADFVLETDWPFSAATRFDGWTIPLLARFNGARTPEEIYASARAAQEMPETFGRQDFSELVALLIERGYLSLAELEIRVTS